MDLMKKNNHGKIQVKKPEKSNEIKSERKINTSIKKSNQTS
jgi:hypothetical protein